MQLTPPLQIAIAGSGLLGRLLAWQLSLLGHKVVVYDKRPPERDTSAAYTAAGMLAPISEAASSLNSNVLMAGIESIQQWSLWCQSLNLTNALHHGGSLVLAHPQDSAELEQFNHDCRALRDNESLNIKSLNRNAIAELEPHLSKSFEKGLWINPEAHLDNRQLLNRLDAILATQQVTFNFNTDVNVGPGEISETQSDKIYRYDWVIDCRGAGARSQLGQLRGVRGETLHLHTREISLRRPIRLMHPRYQLYVVPKPEHRFVVGATQLESEDVSPISLQSSLELASAVYTIAPAFSEARVLEAGVNLRPAFRDNLPQVTTEPGLVIANGLYRHGYLLAPLVVEQTISIVAGNNNYACEKLSAPPLTNRQAVYEI
ncbi:FAD-dependent oxidoreductase [Gilvimarinus sp. SDUM040013]|uniref:FAD-dependent oxidoreductase n=1 Tax=Gilvimarinus gilvus TaxID=3058038 RepID=A0ABU4RUD6_9GAMM|nr:FAD-dependent oxidoreductase [Gilvimarinus sp. SDUM040013]MDO3385115.1 FAD-dependent oxidoreductase [Gilvimarinus sp. SDUM040013]MDX6848490.1 FAD-dependent oxidoreductase [Gilvimarinus sp. SDUM040013]